MKIVRFSFEKRLYTFSQRICTCIKHVDLKESKPQSSSVRGTAEATKA